MKSLSLALCLIALCAFASDTPTAEHSQNGRYRLLRATVSVAAFGKADTTFDQQCVLKIDSATGRTWLLMYGINLSDPRKSVCNFSEIPDGGFVVKPAGQAAPVSTNMDYARALGWLEWAAENPDGGSVPDGKGGETFMPAAAVSNMVRELRALTNKTGQLHDQNTSH